MFCVIHSISSLASSTANPEFSEVPFGPWDLVVVSKQSWVLVVDHVGLNVCDSYSSVTGVVALERF